MSPLMSVRQVSKHLGVSTKSIYRLAKSGRLRAYRPTRKLLRFRMEDVEKLTAKEPEVMDMETFITRQIAS